MLLAPTHEEMFTLLVKDLYSSYKDLPLVIYQIQNKFRDEARPRAGLLRGREFTMKDSVQLRHRRRRACEVSYHKHRVAYQRTFERLGMPYVIVSAMSGAMGGSASEEFLAPMAVGEDTYVRCTNCDYAANTEAVQVAAPATVAVRRAARRAGASTRPTRPPSRPWSTCSTLATTCVAPTATWTAADTLKNLVVKLKHPDGTVDPAGHRRARRPRGRHEAPRGAGGAGRDRAVQRGRLRRQPAPGQGLHRPRRAGRGQARRHPLPGRPAHRRRHRWITGADQPGRHVVRPRRRARLRRRRHHRGRRGARRRPVPGVRLGAGDRPRHRDRPHLPARPQVRRGARASPCSTRTARPAGRHHGLVRHRRVACRGRHRRAELRRQGPDLAARGRARRRAHRGHRQGHRSAAARRRSSWPPSARPPACACCSTTASASRPASSSTTPN